MKVINKLKKVNWKNLLERAFHSFWQGFLSSLIITGWSQNELKIALIGALTGGLSALKTLLLELTSKESD
jgi:chemotaxis response regulator CheB